MKRVVSWIEANRAKLKPHGVEIATWRGIGYYMSDENKEKLLKLMEKKDD